MRVALFCHSLISDWNHGNAHFLRGVASELMHRGIEVRAFEPSDAWSAMHLEAEHGPAALDSYQEAYPLLRTTRYDLATFDIDEALDGVDLVLVHEWSEPELVRTVGAHRVRTGGYTLLFLDTHHRAVTRPDAMRRYDLSSYDGALVFGEILRQIYLERGWVERVHTWHEAADTRVFFPLPGQPHEGDLVWIGNWGDDERTAELREFLIEPVRSLGLSARIHGVRYPETAISELAEAGIEFEGYLPNHRSPRVFARFRTTVHVPRRPYLEALPGIPTIRMFEALACGIPLVCARWDDEEGLFSPGRDYLCAASGEEMRRHLRALRHDADMRRELAEHGLGTILERHTCAHRVNELLVLHESVSGVQDSKVASAGLPEALLP